METQRCPLRTDSRADCGGESGHGEGQGGSGTTSAHAAVVALQTHPQKCILVVSPNGHKKWDQALPHLSLTRQVIQQPQATETLPGSIFLATGADYENVLWG